MNSNRTTDLSVSDALAQLQAEHRDKVDVVLSEVRDVVPTVVDFDDVIDSTALRFNTEVVDAELLPIRKAAHRHIASRSDIPLNYYRRMVEHAPELWRDNVAHWWSQDPKQRLVRTFGGDDGAVRAVLSSRYQTLDSIPFLEAVLSAAHEAAGDDIQILSMHAGEDRAYMKLALGTRREMKAVGETLQQGLIVSNSEVGSGSVKVEPWALITSCTNGMVSERKLTRVHLGGELPAGVLSPDTIAKRSEAVWGEVKDFTTAALSADNLDLFVGQIEGAASNRLDAPAKLATANLVNEFSLTSNEGSSIFERFLRDADRNGESQWGLTQAVTRVAQDATSYERQVELETVGGKLLGLEAGAFDRIVAQTMAPKRVEKLVSAA